MKDEKVPLVGGLLNLLIPGLAHVYVRRWLDAVVTFIGVILFFGVMGSLLNATTRNLDLPGYFLPLVGLALYIVLLFADGVSAVRRYNERLNWVRCPVCGRTNPVEVETCLHCNLNFHELPPDVKLKHTSPPRGTRSVVVLIVGLVLIFVLLLCVVLVALFGTRQVNLGDWEALISRNPPTREIQRPESTPIPLATRALIPTSTTFQTPTATPLPALALFSPPAACMVADQAGITCLDAQGWMSYPIEELVPVNEWLRSIYDLAFCPDGRLWLARTSGIVMTDGVNWQSYDTEMDFHTPYHLSCDPAGGAWLAFHDGIAHFEQKLTRIYPLDEIGIEAEYLSVGGIAMAPGGRLWVIFSNHAAVLEDGNWTVFGDGQGFERKHYLDSLAVGEDGTAWIGTSSDGVLQFDGETWTLHDRDDLVSVEALVVDPLGRVWVGTYSHGLTMFNGAGWTNYNRSNSGLSSDHVLAIAVDDRGRAWIATEWGLDVFDGETWQAYHMHTANLVHNEFDNLAVSGPGPDLPDLVDNAPGSLSGRIILNGEPVPDTRVEICVETMGMFYSGDTPCTGQPFRLETKTDAEGNFRFEQVPAGYYIMVFDNPQDGWMQMTGASGLLSRKVPVQPGEQVDLGRITIEE